MKLTQEELQAIYTLRQRQTRLKQELGNIGQERLNLSIREAEVEKYYRENLELEKVISTELKEKYGEGSIDIESGEFIPVS